MIPVNIHIFQGTGTEQAGKFDEMRTQGLDQFKNHLLTTLGHVGISFPPDTTIYGYGPNITKKVLDELDDKYMESDEQQTRFDDFPWTATNFLLRKDSPEFIGKITKDTAFFKNNIHETFPLIALVSSAKEALGILCNIKTTYRIRRDDGTFMELVKPSIYGLPGKVYDPRENCLTAIFNHLPLTYQNGKQVVLTTVYMLSQTLKELRQGTREACAKNESGSPGESKEGGRRRRKKRKKKRKTKKRKSRKKRKTKKKRKSRKRRR